MAKKFFILFFRTRDNKFYYLNSNNEGIELTNPEDINKDEVIENAKRFKKSEFDKISKFVYSNFNAKSQYCTTNFYIYKFHKFDIKSRLTIFDKIK